ncbi:hypothetical protein Desku_1566 [Desulfofundulus kuznetsovii DSM 6115]|uniref:Protein kinase domain-containing protein n=1 Tax=Desulfofundulus kuznetsovii (strain DSM 6115 / VKM B-1805 / 17) TaxID=760568 RepID=A0AAU8PT84_DESK7|nr:hypothetical protein Desku_1566 [Desulfofundulus kuznetsovii DSM 6115]
MLVYDSRGQPVKLGAIIGRGGEGSVFSLPERPDLVAKIYHTVEKEKIEKISFMVKNSNNKLLRWTAWPVDTLHNSPNGQTVGFLMPKADGKSIHLLFGPKSRLVEFPKATWPFLIHTATNLARAFALIHENGYVIGDVNDLNIRVTEQAIVKLIDCDSFQVKANGRYYLCRVAVSTYLPPELHGVSLNSVVRTINHDNFGLAVLIFQLLFMGRHPFSGQYLGRGDAPTLEQNIQNFRFAYSSLKDKQIRQPPGTLSLSAVSPGVAELFERAFSPSGTREGGRPSAREWVKNLNDLLQQVKVCSLHNGHHYFKALTQCPWCIIERETKVRLYNFVITSIGTSSFNLEAVWAAIERVPSPGPAPPFPKSNIKIPPNSHVFQQGSILKKRKRIAAVVAIIGILSQCFLALRGSGSLWVVVITILVATFIARFGTKSAYQEAKKAYQQAKERMSQLQERWHREVGEEEFKNKLTLLFEAKQKYKDMPNLRHKKIKELEGKKMERQLKRFLDLHRLVDAKIDKIGPTRKAVLRSYGIETAADIDYRALKNIPGFGPVLIHNLVKWRQEIEKRFVFDPTRALDPTDLAEIDREIEMEKHRLEQLLLNGATELERIAQQIHAKRQALLVEVEKCQQELAQAQAMLSWI